MQGITRLRFPFHDGKDKLRQGKKSSFQGLQSITVEWVSTAEWVTNLTAHLTPLDL